MVERPQPILSSRNQTRITPGAVVCSECELSGEVTIGANTIIHPKARILAEAGPIQIGAFNLIEEQVEIINRTPDSVLKIGDHNVFEVGARCEAAEIGDNNVFEAKSTVGPQVRITNGCVIGAMCSLTSNETLPECTVIYGDQGRRRVASERPPAQTLQLDFLTKILPNYHHLLKASRTSTLIINMDEAMSVLLPGESGSIAEVLGPTEGLGQAGASEITDAVSATAAFHFTGTSASANGATMQEYFIQSAITTPQQHELLITRLRGLCHEWTEFCDQEVVLQLGGDDRSDSVAAAVASRATSNSSAAAGVLASSGQIGGRVTVRVRKSLTAKRRLSYVRYLGAVETDKLVSRRSCLEVPVCGPLIGFLQELGFDQDFTYVAEGHMFVRGRVKTLVYTVNEVVQFHNPTNTDPVSSMDFSGFDPLPKEWRRICPRSWMVEISAVGCPADESMQDEVSDFVDLLHPLIIPAKVDYTAFILK